MKGMTDELKKLLTVAAFAVILFWALQHIGIIFSFLNVILSSFSPIILGVVIAFIVNMPMKIFEDKLLKNVKIKGTLKRALSLLLAYLVIVAVIFVVVFMLFPQLGKTVMSISNVLPVWAGNLGEMISSVNENFPEISQALGDVSVNQQEITKNLMSYFQNAGTRLINSTVAIASSIVSGITKLFLGIVFSAYMLINKETLLKQGKIFLFAFFKKERAHNILGFLKLCNVTFHSFVAGQCMEAVILGLMFTVTMTVFSFPFALLIGVLISFTALIPIVGAFIGCGVGVFLIFMESPSKALWFILLFLVLQQVEGNFIYPKVVGNSVGLPSMWVLAAVTCGGTLMGVVGMLIFIPIFSVVYTVVGKFVDNRLKKREIDKNLLD